MSKWVQLRQAQLAKETLQTQQAMLDLQTRENKWDAMIERDYPIGREGHEGGAAQSSGATPPPPPPPPPGPDATARVAELEARVASLEARLQWCIDALQARNG